MDKRVSEAPQRHGSNKVIHGIYEPEIDGLIAAEHDEEVRALMALYVTSCRHRKFCGFTIIQKLNQPAVPSPRAPAVPPRAGRPVPSCAGRAVPPWPVHRPAVPSRSPTV